MLKYYPAVKIIQPELRDVIVNTVQALLSAGRTEVKTYGVDGTPEVVELVKDRNAAPVQ